MPGRARGRTPLATSHVVLEGGELEPGMVEQSLHMSMMQQQQLIQAVCLIAPGRLAVRDARLDAK